MRNNCGRPVSFWTQALKAAENLWILWDVTWSRFTEQRLQSILKCGNAGGKRRLLGVGEVSNPGEQWPLPGAETGCCFSYSDKKGRKASRNVGRAGSCSECGYERLTSSPSSLSSPPPVVKGGLVFRAACNNRLCNPVKGKLRLQGAGSD